MKNNNTEIELVRLKHKLDLKRIIFEKLLLGGIVLIFWIAANMLLEDYKSSAISEQFFIEKQYATAAEFRIILSSISLNLVKLTEFPCTLAPDLKADKDSLQQSINLAFKHVKSSSLLFTRDYLEEVNLILNIFSGTIDNGAKISCEHRYFFMELIDYITYLSAKAVGLNDENWEQYKPIHITQKNLDRVGTVSYLNQNFEKWKDEKQ